MCVAAWRSIRICLIRGSENSCPEIYRMDSEREREKERVLFVLFPNQVIHFFFIPIYIKTQPSSTPSPTLPRTSQQPPPQNNSICCNRLFPCIRREGDPVRSCWDDWFHTISYTPTFLLLAIIFLAYFATIVIFAGFYYAVNKLGVYYGHNDEGPISTDGVIHGGNGVPPDSAYLESSGGVYSDEGEGVESFCGMDVNTFMEGESISLCVCMFV
jgi:hypothetical protein